MSERHPPAFAPEPPVLFVSPHLDDVVHSCAHFLERNPAATVVTVFAGAPQVPASRWDRGTTGEAWAPSAVGRRRDEDAAALAELGATPVWLPLADGLYGPPDPAEVRTELGQALSQLGPSSVVAPLGIRHPDHVAVSDACLALANSIGATWYLYQEVPYAQEWPELASQRLTEVSDRVEHLVPLRPVPADDPATKAWAMDHYGSQVPALRRFVKAFDISMGAAERYWRVAV
jgi:LmbE family N-acetylglucosaminyl deacetylase